MIGIRIAIRIGIGIRIGIRIGIGIRICIGIRVGIRIRNATRMNRDCDDWKQVMCREANQGVCK